MPPLTAFWQKEVYHDAVHPSCNVLNYEKIEEPLPTFIEINGKSYQVLGQIQHGATSKAVALEGMGVLFNLCFEGFARHGAGQR